MELLETKEREVKECQEEYDKAMTFKQVSNIRRYIFSILLNNNFVGCTRRRYEM